MLILWGLLLILILLPGTFAANKLEPHRLLSLFNLTQSNLSDPPFNPFEASLDDSEQGLVEIKHLPPNPLTSSWSFFTFMSHNKAIPPNSIITFSLAAVDEGHYTTPKTCKLPQLPTDSFPFDLFPANFPDETACIAVDLGSDPHGLSPMNAGTLYKTTGNAANTCNITFRSTYHVYIPPQWTISCLVQYTTTSATTVFESTQLIITNDNDPAPAFTLDPDWRLKHQEHLPVVTPLKQSLVWLDLDAEYTAGPVQSFQRIDWLRLTFTNLPPNVAIPLEFAFDINDLDRLDRLIFLGNHVSQIWAEAMQVMILPNTNFQSPTKPTEARFVYSSRIESFSSRKSDSSQGFYLMTGDSPPTSVQFHLPVPINSILGNLLVPDQQLYSQQFWPIHHWHGQNIAVYVRLQQQRLFRFDSTHPHATWDLRTPLLHQYYYTGPQDVRMNKRMKDDASGVALIVPKKLLLRTHILVIGSSPTIQLVDYNGPSLPHFSFEKLMTPIAEGGYLDVLGYYTSPANSRDPTTRIPLTLTTPHADPQSPPYTFQPHVFEFSTAHLTEYSGYANITIAFDIPADEIYPFSIGFVVNGRFNRTISMYPENRLRTAISSISDDHLQLQHTIIPDHHQLRFECTTFLIHLDGSIEYTGASSPCIHDIVDEVAAPGFKKRDKQPVKWDFRLTGHRLSRYEMRSPSGLLPTCQGFYSTTLQETDPPIARIPLTTDEVHHLFTEYNIPYPSTPSPIHITSGIIEDFLPVISPDFASWIALTAYTFPHTDIVFTCDYSLVKEMYKPDTLHSLTTVQNRQNTPQTYGNQFNFAIEPDMWTIAPNQEFFAFHVQYSQPVLTDADFQHVLKTFVDILQQAKYFPTPHSPPQPSLFHDIKADDIYISHDPNFAYGSLQYSNHYSSLVRQPEDIGPYKLSLYAYSQYNTAYFHLSIPTTSFGPQRDEDVWTTLTKHTFTPSQEVMILPLHLFNATLGQHAVFTGPVDPVEAPRPYASLVVTGGMCYSSSNCVYISPTGSQLSTLGRCIKGKCVIEFHAPELTVREYYILEQHTFHKNWLDPWTFPDVPDDMGETHGSTFFTFIMMVLGGAGLAAIFGIVYLCYSTRMRPQKDDYGGMDQDLLSNSSVN